MLVSKLDQLRVNEPLFNLDFYVIVETNLNNNFNSSELGFSSYNKYRCGRDYVGSGVSMVSGVLICIGKKFISKCLNVPPTCYELEQLFFLVKIGNKDLIIIGVYFPPKTSNDTFIHFSVLSKWC